MTQLSSTSPLRRHQRRARAARSNPVQVVVDWSDPAIPGSTAARVELEAESRRDGETRWVSRHPSGSSWEETLAAAGCAEVVLTAELGDDPEAKHLVFGLADRLTRALAATQSVVRVRFLAAARHERSRLNQ